MRWLALTLQDVDAVEVPHKTPFEAIDEAHSRGTIAAHASAGRARGSSKHMIVVYGYAARSLRVECFHERRSQRISGTQYGTAR